MNNNAMNDRELAGMLNPLLLELESRMVMRGEGGLASQIVKLRTYVVARLGVDKALAAAKDTKTRPMFPPGDGKQSGKDAAANQGRPQ